MKIEFRAVCEYKEPEEAIRASLEYGDLGGEVEIEGNFELIREIVETLLASDKLRLT